MSESSIGIFDSGFGGLTVMRALIEALPYENIVYFGDTARLPYGEKSAEAVRRFSLENANFLLQQNIKLLVVACSTACSVGILELLEPSFPVPVIGMIEPAIDHLKKVVKEGSVVVLGTRRTIQSGVYQRKLQLAFPENERIDIACPLFVPLVEEGYCEHKLAELAAWEYLHPLKEKKIDSVLMGCTHYPLLKGALQKVFGEKTFLLDPGVSCAMSVRNLLLRQNLFNFSTKSPNYRFFVSDDPQKFQRIGQTFFGSPMPHVCLVDEKIYTDNYTAESSRR